ncbi:MAG: excinuclease ABC subunit UvrA [Candidatus Aminicenantes bacterium]|nr:excinuclease ABC subunit UvrA [Candidatus Aminicenantes bacterium]
MLSEIRIKKAAQHNLKGIDVTLPRNRLIVITGPSGSGKSSLAFDTLFAEGQRRYLECLSAYARQFLEIMPKPEMESIEGISPSISIDQKTITTNPRSTVGTVTEIHDFLRLLFARVGLPHCPQCGQPVQAQSRESLIVKLKELFFNEKLKILAPLVRGRKGEYTKLFERLRRRGYIRVRVDGRWRELDEDIWLEKTKKHDIEVLVDEVFVSPAAEKRLKEAVEKALELAGGDLIIIQENGQKRLFSVKLLCPFCEISLPRLEPRFFSYNSPYGACPECHGLGYKTRLDEWGEIELTEEACSLCQGSRLKKESLSVLIQGKNIHELSSLPVTRLIQFLSSLSFPPTQEIIASKIIKEILSRLQVMEMLGLGYLQLSRPTSTLSGGEAQRVRLTAQIGARLKGVLYVLDEPTIGLHQRDNNRLINLLRAIRDAGNTVVVVEHDEQTIRSADYILDLGPGAGEKGGYKVAEGSLSQVLSCAESLTAQYLRGEREIPIPTQRRQPKGWLIIRKASEHNLKGIDVKLPLGVMTAVTGVSGSGKSTLVSDILLRALMKKLYRSLEKPGKHEKIEGLEQIDKVVAVDQRPIGRTPRSNPATYTGIFTPLRQLFARTLEARMRGYSPSRFSFNLPGGRCEECQGAGVKKIEMHFLPDVLVTCDRCGGRRYNKETLAVLYHGKNIASFLDMTVDEAYEELKAHPLLKKKLATLQRVGLGYLRLGQPAPTLSGGEAQRIKLTKELSRKNTGKTLYILDEPTTGLHFEDVRKLIELLHELVDLGNTVLIIEHNLDVIKSCDYVIDLGPEGGEEGGWVVAAGPPEEIAENPRSYTGQFLKKILKVKPQDRKFDVFN